VTATQDHSGGAAVAIKGRLGGVGWRVGLQHHIPVTERDRARDDDRGTGIIGSVAGLVVTLMLMIFAAQLLLGLYATSTVRAVLHDAASRAADDGGASPAELVALARQAEASLGEMGRRTQIDLQLEDVDGDGLADVVVGHATATPPRLVPRSIGGMVGFEHIHAGVRVRVERQR
jgi:hypothetical protein